MSSTQCACDMLMEKVSYAVERLDSIHEGLTELSALTGIASLASVRITLRGLQTELLSALRSARLVHTTEPQTCGQTKLNTISKDTLEAIEVSALLLVQSMKMIVGNEVATTPTKSKEEDEDFHHNADGDCSICLRASKAQLKIGRMLWE